jgi:2-polyprenylphenol 6-hydroxylase
VLTKYQRERAEDILSVFTLTDGLQKLFKTTNPLVRALRNRGMNVIDQISPAKSALIQRALL